MSYLFSFFLFIVAVNDDDDCCDDFNGTTFNGDDFVKWVNLIVVQLQ